MMFLLMIVDADNPVEKVVHSADEAGKLVLLSFMKVSDGMEKSI
jgi:hypothetical protein